MAVTRLKRKARKNKTVGRLKQQHIKLNKRVIMIKSPNKIQQDGEEAGKQAAAPVNPAEAPATPATGKVKPNAETQVDSLPSGTGKSDGIDEVSGGSENTPV